MESPFGPLGTVKGSIIGLGSSGIDLFKALTEEYGLPRWAAFLGLSVFMIAIVFFSTVFIMWIFSKSPTKNKRD
jgi:hypothetical protein